MKTVLAFLEDLAKNNHKEWFTSHKPEYDAAKAKFDALSIDFIENLSHFDTRLVGLTLKEATFRIYHDLRFHRDRPPYKNHFCVYACPYGKNSGYAGYYLHIEPIEDTFLLCSGLYNPTPAVQKRIREEFAHHSAPLIEALQECSDFHLPWDTAYKKIPRGFSATDTNADYYRLRSYELYKKISVEDFLRPDFVEWATAQLKRTYRFNEILNRCVDEVREEGL